MATIRLVVTIGSEKNKYRNIFLNGGNKMSARKKIGISLFVAGAAALLGGFLAIKLPEDPMWWGAVLQLVGFVMDFFGFKFVYPDIPDA